MAEAIRIESVSKRFGSSEVLRGLSFSIGAGERVAVIGPSGSGKTTLLRLMSGMIWPSDGRVLALGRDTQTLSGRALRELRRDIGLLYQNDNLIPGLRVVHNVLMGRLGQWGALRALMSLVWPRELDVARAALAQVELEHKLWDLPGTLSGGQQQRVAIARLIVQRPRVMLADEPSASLDIRLGREVIERLAALSRETGAALVVSLHSLDLLAAHFERVIALRAGEVFWEGAPKALSRAMLLELYGSEYTSLHLDEAIAGSVA